MSIFKADWRYLREAVDAIRMGYIIAYPTETFYGLGVDPFNRDAIKRLFELKGRERKNPLPILIPDIVILKEVVQEIPIVAERLIRRFWPGPLTIVFKASPLLPEELTGGTERIGVRMSSNPVAQRLVEFLDAPLTTTSANPSGNKGALTPAEVYEYFGDRVAIILDGGKLSGKKGSTVIDVTTKDLIVIREGDITAEEINKALTL